MVRNTTKNDHTSFRGNMTPRQILWTDENQGPYQLLVKAPCGFVRIPVKACRLLLDVTEARRHIDGGE